MTNPRYLPVTEKDQFDFFCAGMRQVERDALNTCLKMNPLTSYQDSGGVDFQVRLSGIVQYIFLSVVLSRADKKYPDTLTTFETITDACSTTFLSFILKLDLGGVGLPFCPSPGQWKRLPYNIGKLQNLRYLYLNGQPIEDLTPLKPLELNFICLEACPISNVSPLNLKRLGWLNIRDTKIKDLSHIIEHGHSLGIIPLERTPLSDLDQIEGLTKLSACTALWLEGSKVADELPDLLNSFEKTAPGTLEIVNHNEIKRRSHNMLRPTHYMSSDYLDFVKEI